MTHYEQQIDLVLEQIEDAKTVDQLKTALAQSATLHGELRNAGKEIGADMLHLGVKHMLSCILGINIHIPESD